MTMLLACLLAQATTETYDVATFRIPGGKRGEVAGGVTYTEATAAGFCQILVSKALVGSGDPAKDFDAEWAVLVAKPYTLKGERKSGSTEWHDGWTLTLGGAPAHVEGPGDFQCILAVFSGHGRRASVLVNYNDESFRPKIDGFLDSLRFAKPAPAAPVVENPAQPPPFKGRAWYRSLSQYALWGLNPSPEEFAKAGNQGYSKWTYVFNEDGSYAFNAEYWSMNKIADYWFHEESGTYVVEGELLRLAPKKAERVLRDKAGKTVGEPAPIALEATTYRRRFHYLSGMQDWYLVLTPDGDKRTDRDGPPSTHALFPTSYLYGKAPVKR